MIMGALIGGIAVSALISGISGYMGAKAQAEAYKTLARATEQERREFQKAYDQAFGSGSYNAQIQEIGAKAGKQYYSMLNDEDAWNRYIDGDRAYVAPQDFSFTEKDFTDDPSYKVRLKEGLDSLQQSYVAQGMGLSGPALDAINDYAQEQASKEYGNAYNRKFQQYTDDRNFDYNAWKSQADQYYQNLITKLQGLGQVSNQGVQANSAQAQALAALAGNNASAIQQQATANGAAGMANTQATTSVLDAISKAISMGAGLAASQSGATPNATTTASSTPTNTAQLYSTTLENGVNAGGQDFSRLFLNGWNPAVPTTQNLIGA